MQHDKTLEAALLRLTDGESLIRSTEPFAKVIERAAPRGWRTRTKRSGQLGRAESDRPIHGEPQEARRGRTKIHVVPLPPHQATLRVRSVRQEHVTEFVADRHRQDEVDSGFESLRRSLDPPQEHISENAAMPWSRGGIAQRGFGKSPPSRFLGDEADDLTSAFPMSVSP